MRTHTQQEQGHIAKIVDSTTSRIKRELTHLNDSGILTDQAIQSGIACFRAPLIDRLRGINFDSFGILLPNTSGSSELIDPTSMLAFEKHVRERGVQQPERCITFLPGTSIFLTLDRQSHELADAIKSSFAWANDQDLQKLGELAIQLSTYVKCLENTSKLIQQLVSLGTLPEEFLRQVKVTLTPLGPIDANVSRIEELARLAYSGRKKLLSNFDDETTFFVLALTLVYLEQHPELARSHVDSLLQLPELIGSSLQQDICLLDSKKPLEIYYSHRGSETINTNPLNIKKETPFETAQIPDIAYDPRRERIDIQEYLISALQISSSTARQVAKHSISLSLTLKDFQSRQADIERLVANQVRTHQLFSYSNFGLILLQSNPFLLALSQTGFSEYKSSLVEFFKRQSQRSIDDSLLTLPLSDHSCIKDISRLKEFAET